jgi:hypothetical protein
MPKRLQVVTNSELECWRTCPARWGFAYVDMLRPPVSAPSLRIGDIYHGGVAAGWTAAWASPCASTEDRRVAAVTAAETNVVQAFVSFREHMLTLDGQDGVNATEILAESEAEEKRALWMVGFYFQTISEQLQLIPLAIETSYEVPIPNAVGRPGKPHHSGKIDLVLLDPSNGSVIVDDHKTTKYGVQTQGKKLLLNTQISGYLRAVQSLKPHGATPGAIESAKQFGAIDFSNPLARFTVIRSTPPAQPKINLLEKLPKGTEPSSKYLELRDAEAAGKGNQGLVSVAAIDTLPEIYSAALEAQFFERELQITDKQRERLATLRVQGNGFFAQHEFTRGAEELERWRAEIWIEAARMREAEKDPRKRTRNPGACTALASPDCPYHSVCLDPYSQAVRKFYRVATTRHEEVANGIEEASEGHPVGF